MNPQFAIGFALFFPKTQFLERLRLSLNRGYRIYIYDNSPSCQNARNFSRETTSITYLTSGKNAGLGVALSTLCAQAYYDGNESLLFFDQDTSFSNATLDYIEDCLRANKKFFFDYSVLAFDSQKTGNLSAFSFTPLHVKLVRNSGSLFVLRNLCYLGWHDISFFVDSVDYKFCLDSAEKGFLIGAFYNTPGFDHITEQEGRICHFWGKHFPLRSYSCKRVKDTVVSSFRLLVLSLKRKRLDYFAIFSKLFFSYCFIQIFSVCWLGLRKGENDDGQ